MTKSKVWTSLLPGQMLDMGVPWTLCPRGPGSQSKSGGRHGDRAEGSKARREGPAKPRGLPAEGPPEEAHLPPSWKDQTHFVKEKGLLQKD